MNPEFNGRKRSSIIDQWRYLAANGSIPSSVYRTTKNSAYFVKRLAVKEELAGHNGCVNTVHWNKSGTILLSGSDDRYLNLYSYPSFRVLERIKSGHRANIFNARFMPHSNDTKICSCSGDGVLHYNNLTDKRNYGKNPFKCHVGIVYDVVTHSQDPNGFLSCGEDGTVRYFDLRTTSSCNCSHCSKHAIIDIKQPITSCSVNPFNPNEIVVGCDDSTIRAYDRRFRFTQESKKISQPGRPQTNTFAPMDPATTGLIYAFRPSTQTLDNNSTGANYSNRLTCVTFNWRGDEILASYCPSLLTLFSTKPKFDTTIAEASSIRSSLFNEFFLYPGAITPETNKPNKILLPFGDVKKNEDIEITSQQTTNDGNSNNISNQGTPSLISQTSMVDDTNSTIETSVVSQNQSPSYDSAGLNIFPQIQSRNDTANDAPLESRRLSSIDVGDDDDDDGISSQSSDIHEFYEQSSSVFNQEATNNNEDIIYSGFIPNSTQDNDESSPVITATTTNRSSSTTVNSAPNFITATSLESNIASLTDNTSQSMNVSYATSIDTDDHSSRTVPSRRTRSTVSSENYRNSYNQNNSEGNTYNELTNVTTATQLPHHIGSAPSMESQPLTPERLSTSKKQKSKPRSRYSAWDCAASSSLPKTNIVDNNTTNDAATATTATTASSGDRARRSNFSNFNQSEMEYNPTFFNTIDSLTTTGNHDRLRAYIDNLFVPSYTFNYRGHHNSRTMIKECNYYGDDYVMSGSDDGNVFIWDKWTCQLVNVFTGDNNVVNCLQPHPIDPVIACSGIDSSIKIVAPVNQTSVATRDINAIIAANERELRGSNSYYFDATPTMIFHVLLALERIQRNRTDDTTATPSPPTDQSNIEPIQDVDTLRVTREGFRRGRRLRNQPPSANTPNQNLNDPNTTSYRRPTTSSPDVDLDSFYESDVYDNDDEADTDEYNFESSSNSPSSSANADEV